jgi:hypothetical protein
MSTGAAFSCKCFCFMNFKLTGGDSACGSTALHMHVAATDDDDRITSSLDPISREVLDVE